MPSIMKLVAAALAVAPLAAAQTYSNCNPTKKTCPANPGSTESDLKFDFTQPSGLDKWTTTAGKVNTGSNGAEFTINKKGDAPTIQTDFYFFYGEITVEMKSAPGQGIVSSIVLQSDDLDEVDWEGLGGNNGQIQTNYFGKGDTTTYDRDTWPAVATPQDTFHKYTVNWSKESLVWSVDGNVVRTLNYADAQGGSRFPQTPMNLRIGIWAGGDPSNGQGTIDWAGGATDYSAAPFSMYIKSVEIKNANPAESYTWSDMSGSSDSIKFTGSNAVSARSTTTTAAPTSVTEASPAQTSSAEASTTEASSTPTTLATSTQSSSASGTGSSTAASTGASSSGASSSGVSGSSSSAGATQTGSGSGSGSSSSGSGSSGTSTQTGSGPGSSTSASASASSSPAFNAASNVAASYMGPVSILALVATFFQL